MKVGEWAVEVCSCHKVYVGTCRGYVGGGFLVCLTPIFFSGFVTSVYFSAFHLHIPKKKKNS